MIIACYNVYNEAKYLEESLKAIKKKVDYIIVVDGAYKKFPHAYPFSTDGSLKISKKYANKVISKRIAWNSEIEKRNQYLIGKPGDTYLVIDGHEIWEGELKLPFKNYRIKIQMKDGPHEFFRMFIHQNGIHYKENHYDLWVGNKLLYTEETYPFGQLRHKDECSPEREEAKEKYYSIKHFDT